MRILPCLPISVKHALVPSRLACSYVICLGMKRSVFRKLNPGTRSFGTSYLQIHHRHLPFLPAAVCWLLNQIQAELPVFKDSGINSRFNKGLNIVFLTDGKIKISQLNTSDLINIIFLYVHTSVIKVTI